MRSEIGNASIPDSINVTQHVDDHDMGIAISVSDENQVRNLLNQYNV